MTSYSGPLRHARAEVVPLVPDLAPQLRQEPAIILNALKKVLTDADQNPDKIAPVDWNKTERHTIAGFMIRQQIAYLVRGTGRNAHFSTFLAHPHRRRTALSFQNDLRKTQDHGAKHVATLYNESTGAQQAWYGLAARRYRRLGREAFSIWRGERATRIPEPTIPLEGLFLRQSMRTDALRQAVSSHFNIVLKITMQLPPHERLRALHDLEHHTTSSAGMHFLEFLHGSHALPGNRVRKDSRSEKYIVTHSENTKKKPSKKKRLEKLPTMALKCPAHIREFDEEAKTWYDSPLQDLFHAAINAAVEFEYYRL